MEAAKQEDNDDNEVQKDRALTQVYSKAGWPLRLERHPDVGRYLVATRDIEPGEVILKEIAWASAPLREGEGGACETCFTYAGADHFESKQCTRCKTVQFCSQKCQDIAKAEGSLVHTQEECLALLRWHRERAAHKETFTKDERGEMRLMIKIICKLYHERQLHALERRQRRDRRDRPQQQPQQLQQQKEAEKEEGGERKTTGKRERKQKAITTTYRQFMCLMAGDVGSSSKLNRVRHRASVVLPLFEGKLSYVIKHIDEEKVVDYFLRVESNHFARMETAEITKTKRKKKSTAQDEDEQTDKPSSRKRRIIEYGASVYNAAAMFNHSCFPNACRIFKGQELTLKALMPIKKDQEVNITYIPVTLTTGERQSSLYNNFRFECMCVRCAEDKDGSEPFSRFDDMLFENIICPLCKSGFMVVDRQVDVKSKSDAVAPATTEQPQTTTEESKGVGGGEITTTTTEEESKGVIAKTEKPDTVHQLCILCGWRREADLQNLKLPC